jgi:hypothetical protein
LRREAEAAERERKRKEAEAAAERERVRLEDDAADRERMRKEAEAAAERERLRREAEAAERERKRPEAEAAERERKRLEAEAAERERKRKEAEAAERARLEAEAAAERERVRLEEEAAAERERQRIEALEAQRLADLAREEETAAILAAEAAERADPFADFRADGDGSSQGLLSLMPLAVWARREERPARPAAEAPASNDLNLLIAGLAVPEDVAGVSYARGCKIRRVRVPALPPSSRTKTTRPVILSRRALDDARKNS